jgi:hypothetical protein
MLFGFASFAETAFSDVDSSTSQILNILGQQTNISSGTIDVVSSVLLTGQQLNTSVSSFIPSTSQILNVSGQEITTSIGTYTISAGGAITVVVPEFILNTALGNPVLSTNDFIGITGP